MTVSRNYLINFKEERSRVGVYIMPKDMEMKEMERNLFKIRIGFIDLDEHPLVFHCLDSDRMTRDVMESIVLHWKQWELDRSIEK